jgi:hypothetical protein
MARTKGSKNVSKKDGTKFNPVPIPGEVIDNVQEAAGNIREIFDNLDMSEAQRETVARYLISYVNFCKEAVLEME